MELALNNESTKVTPYNDQGQVMRGWYRHAGDLSGLQGMWSWLNNLTLLQVIQVLSEDKTITERAGKTPQQ